MNSTTPCTLRLTSSPKGKQTEKAWKEKKVVNTRDVKKAIQVDKTEKGKSD